MSIRRKLRIDNKSRRKPAEEDEVLNKQDAKKDINKDEKEYHIKLQKLKAAKNLKLLQNVRLKKKGICVDDSVDEEYQMIETDEKEKKLLDKQFTKNVTEKEIEDAHVEAFIKEHMKAFLGEDEEKQSEEDRRIGTEDEEREQGRTKERKTKMSKTDVYTIDDLYKIPENIQVKSTTEDTSDKLNCVTGITEIPLPVELKLKNIEETEKMKRKILKKAKIIKTKHS